MWRGFGAEAEPELPAQRGYFRPRISSISGVLAMTRQRLFTSAPNAKDDAPHEPTIVAHTASIHPAASTTAAGPLIGASASLATVSGGHHAGGGNHLLLTEQYLLNGGLARCPSPARSSYGDVMSFSRCASARPSIDSQTAHAIYGDPLGIHDPSEADLAGVGPDSDGRFAKRSRKIIRGFVLMVVITLCWVSVIHLVRLSFDTQRVVVAIQPNAAVGGSFANNSVRTRNHRQVSNISASFEHIGPDDERNDHGEPMMESTIKPSSPQIVPQLNQRNQKAQNKNVAPEKGSHQHKKGKSNTNTNNNNKHNRHVNNDLPRSKFDAAYFITWFVTVWNILYLPIYMLIHYCFLRTPMRASGGGGDSSVSSSAVSNNGAFGSANRPAGYPASKDGSTESGATDESCSSNASMRKVLGESIQGLMDRGFTTVQFLSRCAFFCALCLLANYMLFFSLRILDATVVMALFSCTTSIMYLLSWVVLHQQFVGIRIVAVIIVNTGIALLVYMNGVQDRTLATVMIGYGAAIVYAVYKVFMRRMIGFTTFAQMALFHTIVGVLNALIAWPLLLLLYWTGIEVIVWSAIPWSHITGAAACAFLANIITSFGVICTYEAFLTLGMFFAIVISAVIDIYINSVIFREMKLAGVLLICAGFLVVLLPDNWNGYLTNIFRKRLANWKKREELKKAVGRGQDTATGQLSRLRTSSGRVK